jgi:hypothetical protein
VLDVLLGAESLVRNVGCQRVGPPDVKEKAGYYQKEDQER